MKLIALLLSFYMLIGSLIPRTDFSQLMHLGDLKAHYLEHQAEAATKNQSISFLDFCYIHFIDSSEHSEDNHEEEHQQLPFKSLNSIVALKSQEGITLPKTAYQFSFPAIPSYISPFYLNGFLTTICQPPSC